MPKVKGKILFNPLYEGSIILKKLLKDMGYEYSSVEKELSKKLLNEYDALIIQEDRKLSHDEIRDITKFVIENNGGLFVGTETCYNNIGELTKIFGIQMGDTHSDFLEVYTDYLKDRMDLVKYGEKNYKTELIVNREHPLTKGIEEVYSPYDFYLLKLDEKSVYLTYLKMTSRYMNLKVHKSAESLISLKYIPKIRETSLVFPILAASKKYPVAVLSCIGTIFDDRSILYGDNEQLALNLFPWLCRAKKEIHERRPSFIYSL